VGDEVVRLRHPEPGQRQKVHWVIVRLRQAQGPAPAPIADGRTPLPILQNAWDKHGEGNFVFEPLEEVEPSYETLRKTEQHYLDMLKPEYNVSDIADGHFRLGKRNTPDHRAKISASNMGRPGTNKGKRFSEEHRRKISEANKGKAKRPVGYHHSAESIEKMRAKAMDRVPRIQSAKERAKRSEDMRLRWQSRRLVA
jgi:group I intron endonuclease